MLDVVIGVLELVGLNSVVEEPKIIAECLLIMVNQGKPGGGTLAAVLATSDLQRRLRSGVPGAPGLRGELPRGSTLTQECSVGQF